MTDTSLLDGTVDDVKNGLGTLSAEDLAALLSAEQAGKNRKGVIDAIELAQTDLSTGAAYTPTADDADDTEAAAITTAASLDTSAPADIAPATEFEPSGAPIQSSGFDVDHPALDTNPRANTTVDQNRIDFNDPGLSGSEAVQRNLTSQA